MAESLIRHRLPDPCRALAACLALIAMTLAGAQTLPDPMRPPASVLSPQGTAPAPAGSGAPELQSVLISPERRIAIINGQSVRVGDKVGNARVTRIAEGEVTLLEGRSRRTLKIFPDVQKHPFPDRAGGRRQDR